jgi:hypothetical protein
VVGDWAANGNGEDGPPLNERFHSDSVATALRDAGFEIDFLATRPKTLLVVGFLGE